MKKLNNKGITLVELIVSFALVSVSVIYFYQTVYTVRSLYSESQSDTQHYVKVNYALRLANELFTTGCEPNLSKTYKENVFLNAISTPPSDAGYNNVKYNKGGSNGFCEISFYIDTDKKDENGKTIKKEYTLYKPPISIPDASSSNRNAVLLGGAHVDGEEGEKYIVFDGKDDFVQIPVLPGCSSEPNNEYCIKWSEGFIIEFKAQWLDPSQGNSYRRIIDFSAEDATANTSSYSGNQNIYISSQITANQLVFGGRKLSASKEKGENFNNPVHITLSNGNALTNVNTFKAIFTPIKDANGNITNYKREVYLSGGLIHESTSNEFWSDVTRTVNYIGYSPWVQTNSSGNVISQDIPFKGNIYYLKIDAYVGNNTTAANGAKQTILDINANNFED